MKRSSRFLFATITAGLVATISSGSIARAAAGTPKVEVSIVVEREVARTDAAGKKFLERKPVEVTSPGDVLVYTLKAVNVGDGQALEARIEDPLPSGAELLLDSLEGAKTLPTASLDGGQTWQSFPAQVERKATDGSFERIEAPADSYTSLRFTLLEPLSPGESKEVRFKVRVR